MVKVLPMILLILFSCGDPEDGMPTWHAASIADAAQAQVSDAGTAIHSEIASDVPPANLRQPTVEKVPICTKDQAFTLSTSAIYFGKVAPGKHQARAVQLTYAGDCAMPIVLSLSGSDRFTVKILGQTLLTGHWQDAYNLPQQTLEI